jgi:hypothetical protein
MEAAQRPGNADECGGDIAAPGRAKTRKPAARIAVKTPTTAPMMRMMTRLIRAVLQLGQ